MSIRSVVSGTMRKIHRALATKRILVLGDSHVDVFLNRMFIIAFPGTYFDVVSVGGATVSGLENPRSKTQAFQTFDNALHEGKYDKIIVMLGEVDTGFVIWYRAKKYNVDVMEMFDNAVNNYGNFLNKVKELADLIVVSTPLPTIDDQSVGEIVHARKEVITTQKERTELTLRFNQYIEDFCDQQNIKYLNLDEDSINEQGILKDELKNEDPADHHYDFNQYSKLISRKLKNEV